MSAGRVPSPRATLTTPQATVTGAYAVTDADFTVLADASGGAFDVTLPSAVGRKGRRFIVKRISAANTVTVKSSGGTLDGAAAASGIGLTLQYQARELQSDGTNWFVVGAHL